MTPRRHRDTGETLWSMRSTDHHPWWVVCPRCDARARLVATRLTCTACGFDKEDGWRDVPLWLTTPCCGHTLEVVHPGHLALLEDHLLADLRERRRDPAHGWSNRSLASRLPWWLKAAKNREAVARALARLRGMVERVTGPE